MRQLFGEHGRMAAAAVIAGIFAAILLYPEGILKVLGGFSVTSGAADTSETREILQKLSKKGSPKLAVENKVLEIGDSLFLQDMITEASHGTSSDLREQVKYYLEDGTEVNGSYEISGDKPGVIKIWFVLTGEDYMETCKSGYIQIQSRKADPLITALIEEWEMGEEGEDVRARLYKKEDETLLLSLEGKGRVKPLNQDTVPWKDVRETIEVCRIEEGIETACMDGWFYQCRSLKEIPRMPETAESFRFTFKGCNQLRAAGIPDGAKDIEGMYEDCGNLELAGPIPSSVRNCRNTFKNCGKLKGSIALLGCPAQYEGCFLQTATNVGDCCLQLVADREDKAAAAEAMYKEAVKDNSSCRIFVRKM
ncbi:hypothetical protein [Lactonifactor longoviformis]|uniref:hypothetical protein n=1 Tax=Lactonifactor longoviformis TaxID=341220 RepID=UPI0036F36A90